ncbi:DUF3325 domain-containing protein [Pseudorhodoferax sp. Leaf274]|uniref:DUF3325 domain-containing protein n=1 Tax=Pseudorhodoferax sp. Leaf274 TaxID=1736318 RepID=UPI000702B121|nr:DUF3325 domain-containing protein [Pseudorhodoferax sp. Leaf274]KQP35500.1 hypothetical protein ASF44_19385 [Pseudorhodoferax sp. Leaf274]
MRDALLLGAAVLSALAGMGWLALAMEVHWQQVCGAGAPPPAGAQWLRVPGAVALAGSLVLCLAVDHASMAALVWVMSLAAAALCVAAALTWRPHWLRVLVPGAGRPARA